MKKTLSILLLLLPVLVMGQGETIQVYPPAPSGGQTIYVDNAISGGGETIRVGGVQAGFGITNFAVSDFSGGYTLTWENFGNITGILIYISTDGENYNLLASLGAVESYNDSTDYPGGYIFYKIQAYSGYEYSEYSAEYEIVIEAEVENLTATWIDDYARITFDSWPACETIIYESLNGSDWDSVTTLAAGVEMYNNYTWQGAPVYFRTRTKSGSNLGPYGDSIIITTPLVFKFDCNPTASLTLSPFNLAAGDTIRVYWGSGSPVDKYYNDYVTNQTPSHLYAASDEGNQDPVYVKLYGDVSKITTLLLTNNLLLSGNLSRWVLPSSMTQLYLDRCNFTGDISGWTLPSGLTNCRIYRNLFTGDLSSWVISTSASTVMYLEDTDGKNEFTGIPRGNCQQMEAATAGLYMNDCNVSTANIDAWLAWFNTWLVTHPPVRNSIFVLNGTGMGVPTGGNSNANRLGIIAKYTAAGYTATVTTNP